MIKKVRNHYTKIIAILNELHKINPGYNLGRHLSHALDGQDSWSISDKELHFSLEKYKVELEISYTDKKEDIDKIIQAGMNINNQDDESDDIDDNYNEWVR